MHISAATALAAAALTLSPPPFNNWGWCDRIGTPLMTTSPHSAEPGQQVTLIEHSLPIMAPHLYEQALHAALGERGEILRWYVARVEDATAVIECVILAQSD